MRLLILNNILSLADLQDGPILRVEQSEESVVVDVQVDHDLVDCQSRHDIVLDQLSQLLALLPQGPFFGDATSFLQQSLQRIGHDQRLWEVRVHDLFVYPSQEATDLPEPH
jgi:hypothetical protein